MFKTIWLWILNNIFHIQTETKPKEVEDNQRYAVDYERIDEIKFASIENLEMLAIFSLSGFHINKVSNLLGNIIVRKNKIIYLRGKLFFCIYI